MTQNWTIFHWVQSLYAFLFKMTHPKVRKELVRPPIEVHGFGSNLKSPCRVEVLFWIVDIWIFFKKCFCGDTPLVLFVLCFRSCFRSFVASRAMLRQLLCLPHEWLWCNRLLWGYLLVLGQSIGVVSHQVSFAWVLGWHICWWIRLWFCRTFVVGLILRGCHLWD